MKKYFGRSERCKKRREEIYRGNDTTTDRDSYVVTGYRVKNSQHKITKEIYYHSTFHVLFYSVASVRKKKEKRKEWQEERKADNEIIV